MIDNTSMLLINYTHKHFRVKRYTVSSLHDLIKSLIPTIRWLRLCCYWGIFYKCAVKNIIMLTRFARVSFVLHYRRRKLPLLLSTKITVVKANAANPREMCTLLIFELDCWETRTCSFNEVIDFAFDIFEDVPYVITVILSKVNIT